MPPYSRPPLTLDQQLEHLLERGLQIDNEAHAKFYLSNVGFYRFKGYARIFRDLDQTDKPFAPGTHFNHVLMYHEVDHSIRGTLFAFIQRLELITRTSINEIMTHSHGVHWYANEKLFSPPKKQAKDKRTHNELLTAWTSFFRTQDREPFVKHFTEKYGRRALPPSWMLLETMTIGSLLTAYTRLAPCPQKEDIARSFGLRGSKMFRSWLHTVVALRNIVCHHNRVWDADYRIPPFLRGVADDFDGDSPLLNDYRLGAQVFVLFRLINARLPMLSDSLKTMLNDALNGLPAGALERNGLKPEWASHPLFESSYKSGELAGLPASQSEPAPT